MSGDRLATKRRRYQPKVGDLYWVPNTALNIPIDEPPQHPCVVITRGKPDDPHVRVVAGSSTFPDQPGSLMLRVKPSDVEPYGMLWKDETRFHIPESVPVEKRRLGRRIGRISAAQLAELRNLLKWEQPPSESPPDLRGT